MKIVRLSTFLDYGGIESKMIKLSVLEDDNEWIYCAISKGGFSQRAIEKNHKQVVVFNLPHRIPNMLTIYKIWRFLINTKPDVLHCSGAEANFHGVIAGKIARVKKVVTEEIGVPNHGKIARFVFNIIFNLSDAVLGESKYVVENLRKKYSLSENKLFVVPNFCFVPEYNYNFPNGVFTIISVSRLESVKNIEGIIYAVNSCVEQGEKVKYTIVGDGSIKNKLKSLVSDLRLEEYVEFLGYVEDPSFLYLRANLYILNSYSEGFSNSLLEAMALGVPSITTNVGAAEELVQDGKNGWILKDHDFNTLARMICQIKKMDPDELVQVGKNGRQSLQKRFSLERHSEKLLEIYR